MSNTNSTKPVLYLAMIIVGLYAILFYWKRPRVKIRKIDWDRRTADVELSGNHCHRSEGMDFRQNGFQLTPYSDSAGRMVYGVMDEQGNQVCHKTIDYNNRRVTSGSNFDLETILFIAQC